MRSVSFFLAIVLLINSLLLGIANAASFASLKQSLPKDILVICTGSALKYISETALLETGQIVEIDLKTHNISLSQLLDKCPVSTGFEHFKYPEITHVQPFLTILTYVVSFIAVGQQPHSSFAFVLLPSRAPPSLD